MQIHCKYKHIPAKTDGKTEVSQLTLTKEKKWAEEVKASSEEDKTFDGDWNEIGYDNW